MGNEKIGSSFRLLREQRGYSISSFSIAGIPRATLSRFERGESMMSFDKVIKALQYMGVSLGEFEKIFKGFSLERSTFLIQEISKATFTGDQDKLWRLLEVAKDSKLPYIEIAVKASLSIIDETEREKVTSYLYDIEQWSNNDFGIFYLTMNDLNTKDILYIIDSFWENIKKFTQVVEFRSNLAFICVKATVIFSCRGYKGNSKHIFNQIDKYQIINTMYLRNLRNLAEGYWIYKFGDKNEGNKQMVRALEILKHIGDEESFLYYNRKYKEYIKSV